MGLPVDLASGGRVVLAVGGLVGVAPAVFAVEVAKGEAEDDEACYYAQDDEGDLSRWVSAQGYEDWHQGSG